jgi:hypothetical protein
MQQIGGKPVKKSSKTKSSSTSKRHFTVVIGTKEHGLYCSSSPSSAARKAVSKLCGKEKGKKVEFCLREITQGSKKKTYGPYLGHVEKLAKPIQLKGRLIERMPVARLKAKSSAKKGGMRGEDFFNNIINGKRLENSNDKLDNDLLILLRERGNRNKLNSNTKLFETYKFLDIPKEDLKRLIFQVRMQIDMASASPINYELNVNSSNNLKKYSDNYRELMMLLKKKFMKNKNNN